MKYIEELEKCLGAKAKKYFVDIQPGDGPAIYADSFAVQFRPETSVEEGVKRFVEWFAEVYRCKG